MSHSVQVSLRKSACVESLILHHLWGNINFLPQCQFAFPYIHFCGPAEFEGILWSGAFWNVPRRDLDVKRWNPNKDVPSANLLRLEKHCAQVKEEKHSLETADLMQYSQYFHLLTVKRNDSALSPFRLFFPAFFFCHFLSRGSRD